MNVFTHFAMITLKEAAHTNYHTPILQQLL